MYIGINIYLRTRSSTCLAIMCGDRFCFFIPVYGGYVLMYVEYIWGVLVFVVIESIGGPSHLFIIASSWFTIIGIVFGEVAGDGFAVGSQFGG